MMINTNEWNMNDLRVVMAGKPAVSKAMLRIGKQKMTFSMLAAAEMGYPKMVQMLISNDASKMVIRPYDQNDGTAIPFYCEKYSEKRHRMEMPRSISICDKPLVRDIRNRMGWGAEIMACSPLRFQEAANTLFFDLTQAATADEIQASKKIERTIDSYPTLSSMMNSMEPVVMCLPTPTVIV